MPQEENQQGTSLSSSLVKLFLSLFLIGKETIELATLELRLAGKSLVVIIALIFAAVFFFVSTWVTLLAAMVVWLVSIKLSWLFSLLLMALLNLIIIIFIKLLIMRYKRYLTFPATRKQLQIHTENHEDLE